MRVAAGASLVTALALAATACGSAASDTPGEVATSIVGSEPVSSQAPATTVPAADADGCADVVAVVVTPDASGYTFSVTVSSTETGWDKYADAWVVKTQAGSVLGERVLTHPHVEEQPFTRSQSGIVIPTGVEEVVVAAHDSVLGFCGDEITVTVEDGGA